MNEYRDLIRQDKAAAGPQDAGPSPYRSLIKADADTQRQQAWQILERALQDDPDVAAERRRLSQTSGLPLSVVERNLDEIRVKERARAVDIVRMAQESPILARQLMDPTFTTVAVDDIPTLKKIETAVGKAVSYVMGSRPDGGLLGDLPGAATNVGGAAKAGVFRASRGAAGTFQAALELVAPVLDPLEPVTAIGGNPLRRLAEGFAMQGEAAGRAAALARPKTDGIVAGGFFSGVESLTQNLMTLPMAFLPGGQAAALTGMTAFTGGDAYQQAREKGLPMSQALPFAASQAAIEYATEKLPLGALLKDVKAGAGFLTVLGRQIALEVPGEQIATLLQDLNEWAVLNPEKPFSSYLEERPSAAAQTLVATIVGTGGNVAVAKGIEAVVERVTRDGVNMQRAGVMRQALEQAMKGAQASALRERSPEVFRQLLTDMSEGGSVYIDAEVLNQMPADVLQQMEGVAQQLETAAPDTPVAVKVADALTLLPGTPAAEVFMQNARSAPDAPSLLEAEAAGKKAAEFLHNEMARVLQQAQDQEAMRASSEAVRQTIAAELTATGRYRPAVADQMATWATAFYTTMASRVGMTPEQFFQRYRIRVLGAPSQPGQAYNASQPGRLDGIEAYHWSTEARPVLSSGFYGTGLRGSARDEIMSYPDQRIRQRLSFYVDKGTGVRPEAGVGGVAHRVRLDNIYDANVDPLRLRSGNAREFESKVLDAGFDGYLDRLDGDQPGQVILLGQRTLQPEVLGPLSRVDAGQKVPALERREAPWTVQASGAPEMLQMRLARMQASPAWGNYELKIEGDQLLARDKGGVFEQRAERPVAPRAAQVADISNARAIAGTRKWPTNRDFKLALQAAVRAVTGSRDLTKDTPENRAYLVRQLLKEAREALVTNANAVGWYDEKVTTALEVVSAIHPELKTDEQARFAFIWALAVTSNGVKVNKNFELAERAYTYWKANGVMPTANIGVGTAASKIHEGLATYNDLIKRWGYERFKTFATTLQPNRQVKATYGRAVSGEGMDTQVYGAGIVGPKIGNGFFMNLYGEFGQLTMDRWWVRMWGRLTGDLVLVDRQAITESRAAFVSIIDMIKADKAATKVVEQAIKTRLGKGDPIAMAKAIMKATTKKEVRDTLATVLPATAEREAAVAGVRKVKDFVSIGDELRKAAKSYYGALDGQIEVPGGSKRRDMMRAVSQAVLAELQKEQPTLTMADFQALMWYPEKTLYDSAGAQSEESEEGYEDDEAPDYANAAIALAREQGVSDEDINAAVERARSDIQARQRAGRGGRGAGDVPAQSGAGTGDAPLAQGGLTDGRSEPTGNRGGRYSSGSLAPLAGAPTVEGAAGPDPRLVAVAEQYARDNGIPLRRQAEYVKVDVERAKRIAQAYDEMKHDPQDPRVKQAYDDLARQTMAQYQALVNAGYRFWFMDPAADPYQGNPWNAMRDLRANQSMAVFPTESGFGTGEFDPTGNPLLADTGLEWSYGTPDGPTKRVLFNDLFRAVHDAFGHGLEGAGFRAQGEENAWQAHVRLFTGPAVGAITSETRGQNSWLNYGPYGEQNQNAKVEDTVFADQKTGLMPEWTWTEGRAADEGGLNQEALEQGARGTFNPKTLELVLNENADLSTWFHETGHFFLEVLADIASQPGAPAQIVEDMNKILAWFGIKGDEQVGGEDAGGTLGQSSAVRLYHGSKQPIKGQFRASSKSVNTTTFGDVDTERTGVFFSDNPEFSAEYGDVAAYDVSIESTAEVTRDLILDFAETIDPFGPERDLHLLVKNTKSWGMFEGEVGRRFVAYLQEQGYDSATFQEDLETEDGRNVESNTTVVFDPERISPATLAQGGQPTKPQPIQPKRTPLETWNAMTLDQKRPYHERWAESVEQYVMEGKAPSVELQPLMRRFATWLKSGYSSIKQFLAQRGATDDPAQLNDDIRRVMDRMLATDEQIAQAEEIAGMVPDEEATNAAADRLRKRSMADLKFAVKARDQALKELRKQAAAIEKGIREQVTAEVDQMPEVRAKAALEALNVNTEYDAALTEYKAAREAAEKSIREEITNFMVAAEEAKGEPLKGLKKGQFLAKVRTEINNKVEARMIEWDRANPRPVKVSYASEQDVATVADSFGFESVDAMLQSIAAFDRADLINGMTEQRMLEEHGDLVDERAISEAANEAVHNAVRQRVLASELRTQAELMSERRDTGETNARGAKITVNALVEAAKQFGAKVAGRTVVRDLKATAWKHTAAERRAGRRYTEMTAAGKTLEAVEAKRDQVLQNAAAKAALEAQAEARKIVEFFRKVAKGNDEKTVEKGRDPDIVNAARAVLAAYGLETPTTKAAGDYLETLQRNDPDTYAAIQPMMAVAMQNAQPLESLTFEELQGLHEQVEAMWHLAKRSRQMEVDGDLLDIDEVADEVYAKLEEIGIPDTLPGETGALTRREILARQWLQQGPALLRRVEQWAEAKDGKFGGPFLRFIFQPVKDAADRYRTDRLAYRKKFQALVDNIAPTFTNKTIEAPELNYTFGKGHNGIGHAELLHALLHTGNESNKRKLLLGRGWAAENADGTLDTSRWDTFLKRMHDTGVLEKAHWDFVQGVWDLMEETKPLAQKTHRDVFGRYFAEITAEPVETPFGTYRGGYVPAQADPLLVQDADLRELLETENAGMAQAFPQTNRGFTKSRVEYNRPLKLDLRSLPQHIDKVLLFSHMEPAVRGVAKLLRRPKVSQPLGRVDPAAMGGLLKPWLNRAARQTVETPMSADAGLNRLASTVRGRVGMALMFANVSNTLQQITGVFTASLKVKPSMMRRATAEFIRNPAKFKESVWRMSPYMADRASNEVAVLSDTLEQILINPTTYQRAEQFTRRHGYFLQTAFDNAMSPIIWSAAYNQALAEGMDERMAIRFADGTIRQTQGSTMPEDVSRIETGPAYARLFTQFVSYFNMMANTNATAVQQIFRELGLKKGAGKAAMVLLVGLAIPIWVAEAIALGMKGGPDDEDDDGYLDDWLASVFGFGTIKGILAGVPFLGAAAQSAVNRFNDQPADDKFSLSPTVSVLESAVGAPASVYKAIVDDASAQKAVRDTAALITVVTGLPAMTAARPIGYAAGVAQGKVEPTGPLDAARGLITGTASPESKQ